MKDANPSFAYSHDIYLDYFSFEELVGYFFGSFKNERLKLSSYCANGIVFTFSCYSCPYDYVICKVLENSVSAFKDFLTDHSSYCCSLGAG
jgi:hypothetical protein